MPFWRLRLLLLAAAASASLASCSGGDSPLAALSAERRAPNAADAAFLRSMTERAKATLGITQLAQRRALRAELRGRIRGDQHPDVGSFCGVRSRRTPATRGRWQAAS